MSIETRFGRVNRRKAFGLIAISAGGGAFLTVEMFRQTKPAAAASPLITAAGVCTIMPEVTEGPFYLDSSLVRRNITEGKQGVPLKVRLQVVDQRCTPIPGARVDIWHCDAEGAYSGYPGQPGDLDTTGQTFLRGTQMADGGGVAEFSTIYPGWYPGRTPHIHFKAFPDERQVLTGQMFFPDEQSRQIYSTVPPYDRRSIEGMTVNGRDGIARRAGRAAIGEVSRSGKSLEAALIIALDARG
jgi:protocatechuate 3,4-dioxygenase beta subunit